MDLKINPVIFKSFEVKNAKIYFETLTNKLLYNVAKNKNI